MRNKKFLWGLAAAGFVFATLCLAATDVSVGTWKANLEKSKYSPGPPPKSSTVIIEAMGDKMKVTVDGTDGEGKAVHHEWIGKYDGKQYPVVGEPATDSRAYKKVDDQTYDITAKKGDKVMTTGKVVFSKDGKTRTVTTSGTNAKGQKYNNTVVYEKQ
jgi:hypothetical protein